MKIFEKILIANRAEIAVRIIRTVKKLGIRTVAVYSDADSDSLYVNMSDESYYLGEDNLHDSYLNIKKIISAAKRSGADAIHPGYGFLAENHEFAKACKSEGIAFIGPNEDVIDLMGNKIKAGKFAEKNNISVIKNAKGTVHELKKAAEVIGYPILVKAAAGGGGKGMRIVRFPEDLDQALENTGREALNYFGNEEIFIEKYIENPRHIEVQILADNFGNVIHLYERECSIQRRYQKIIEEAPSVTLNKQVREKICETAVKIGKETSYNNAGTVEFLVDKDLNFYFLEMNTRIQVEHPVTELITGVDIVEEQIKIAAGNTLSIKQDDLSINGHSIECRVYAEDPYNNFLPSPGKITLYKEPFAKNIRVDSSIVKEETIHSFFDPMISKLIVWNENRDKGIELMNKALNNYHIHGIKTNIQYLKQLIKHKDYTQNKIHTTFCDSGSDLNLSEIHRGKKQDVIDSAIIAFLLHEWNYFEEPKNIWEEIRSLKHMRETDLIVDGNEHVAEIIDDSQRSLKVKINEKVYDSLCISLEKNTVKFYCNDKNYIAYISNDGKGLYNISLEGFDFTVSYKHFLSDNYVEVSERRVGNNNEISSPMPGKVLKVNVKEGDIVEKNQVLLIVEAMKMENNLISEKKAKVIKLSVKENDMVEANKALIELQDL